MQKKAIVLSFLLFFISLQLTFAQQTQENLASQMIGVWILKDLDVMVREAHKNNPEAQKMLGITKNGLEIQRQTIANSLAVIFEKEGTFLCKPIQSSDDTKGNWRLEGNILRVEGENSPAMALLEKAIVFFQQEKLYMGLPTTAGNQMSGVPEAHMPCFVFEKSTLQDIENAKQTFSYIPEETVFVSNLERFIVHPKKAKCKMNGGKSCLQIKRYGKTDWEYLPNFIEGFKHKKGFEYVIEVRITQNTSDSLGKYALLKVVSKTKKK
jgi:hypothetical protein